MDDAGDPRQTEDARLASYLLGKLSPEEEARLEAQYLADAALQDRLGEAEDLLIDAYLEEELSPEDRAAFSARFLSSPRGARKLAVAQALVRVAATMPAGGAGRAPSRRRWIAGAAGALAAAGLAAAVALLWVRGDRGPAGPVASVTITLEPGATRSGGEPPMLTLPRGAPGATIHLLLDADNHATYHVTLLGAGDRPRWQQGDLRPAPAGTAPRRVLVVDLPAAALDEGQQTLVVGAGPAGVTPVAAYLFLVRRD